MIQGLSRLTSSLAALLAGQRTDLQDGDQMESIRGAMLCALNPLEGADTETVRRTRTHIHHATEVLTLWYLRMDLHSLIANFYCEDVARRTVDDITTMFQGHVPRHMMPRPAPVRR